MRKNIHPKYQKVLFIDSTTEYKFICGSTLQPKETMKFEGQEYPVYRLSTSSASHPYFTGSKQLVDAEGRVDKFKKRYGSKKKEEAKEEKNEE
jgi:large subunit ribosomal protein L31